MMAIFMLPFSTLTRPAAPGEAVSPPPAYIAFPGRVRPWKIRAVFLMSRGDDAYRTNALVTASQILGNPPEKAMAFPLLSHL